jgi:hypothetical protein
LQAAYLAGERADSRQQRPLHAALLQPRSNLANAGVAADPDQPLEAFDPIEHGADHGLVFGLTFGDQFLHGRAAALLLADVAVQLLFQVLILLDQGVFLGVEHDRQDQADHEAAAEDNQRPGKLDGAAGGRTSHGVYSDSKHRCLSGPVQPAGTETG